MNLEDILSAAKEKTQEFGAATKLSVQTVVEAMAHHPFATASLVYCGDAIDAMRYKLPQQDVFRSACLKSTLVYLGCQFARDYFYRRKKHVQEPEKNSSESVFAKGKNYVLDNRTIAAVITGAIAICAMNSTQTLTTFENVCTFLPSYAIMKTLLNLAKYQQELQEVYKQKKEDAAYVQQAVDYMLERPATAATVAGAMTFAHFQEKFATGYQTAPAQTFFLNTIISGAGVAAAYFSALLLASIFHSQSHKYARLAITAKAQKMKGKYDSAIETLSELEKIASPQTKTAIELEKAEILIKQKKYDQGILTIKAILDADETTERRNPIELLYEPLKISGLATVKQAVQAAYALRFHKGVLELGLQAYKDNRPALAKYLLKTDDPELKLTDNNILRMLVFEAINDEKAAQKELNRILRGFKPELFKQIARSSDEVYEYDSSALTRTLVFKKSNNSFEQEYLHTRLFYESMQDLNKIARAITHTKINEQQYLAISRIKGNTVAQMIDKQRMMLPAIELLCEATQKAQENLEKTKIAVQKLDYFKNFKNKFTMRMPCDEELQEELYELGAEIPEYLSRQKPTIIHGNPHSANLISEGDSVCLIDFGDVCLADFGLDLEQTIASISPQEERIVHYENCAEMRNEKVSKETIKRYAYASAFKAAHLFARSVYYKEDNPVVCKQNLLTAVSNLIELRCESNKLARFSDAIQRINVES